MIWMPLMPAFQVKRTGYPIDSVAVKDPVDTGISYSMRFAEIDACIAAGLDWWMWEMNFYPIQIKAEVVVWNKLSKLIYLHTEDARAAKAKK